MSGRNIRSPAATAQLMNRLWNEKNTTWKFLAGLNILTTKTKAKTCQDRPQPKAIQNHPKPSKTHLSKAMGPRTVTSPCRVLVLFQASCASIYVLCESTFKVRWNIIECLWVFPAYIHINSFCFSPGELQQRWRVLPVHQTPMHPSFGESQVRSDDLPLGQAFVFFPVLGVVVWPMGSGWEIFFFPNIYGIRVFFVCFVVEFGIFRAWYRFVKFLFETFLGIVNTFLALFRSFGVYYAGFNPLPYSAVKTMKYTEPSSLCFLALQMFGLLKK